MNSVRIFIVLLMALAASASWWLNKHPDRLANKVQPNTERYADFFLKNFSIHQFHPDGSKQRLLQGRHLEHFPDDDSTQVTQAHIKTQHSAQATWIIDAQHAHLGRNGEQIVLNDEVVMQRLKFAQFTPLRLETELLHLDTVNNRAQTDQAVQLSSPNWHWQAIGMTAELNKNKLTLLSHVKGRHAVQTP